MRSNTCMVRVLPPTTRTEDPVVEVSPPGTVTGGFRNTSDDVLFEPIPETSPSDPREGFRGKDTMGEWMVTWREGALWDTPHSTLKLHYRQSCGCVNLCICLYNGVVCTVHEKVYNCLWLCR